MTTLGIVQVPFGSSPPAGKITRRLGGKSLLEWVVRRVTDCQQLDQLIVVTPRGPEQELLAELVPPDVPVFVGRQRDALGCYVEALDCYPFEAVVRIRADTPFVDPVLIDRLVTTAAEHPHCDYIGYCLRNGHPTILSSVGMFAEQCRADALRQADADAASPADRQEPTRYLYSHPEKFAVRLLPAPAGLDCEDVRLTVQSDEDWEHAQTIFEALGPEALDWQRIAGLLDRQPAMRNKMAVLNRRVAALAHEVPDA